MSELRCRDCNTNTGLSQYTDGSILCRTCMVKTLLVNCKLCGHKPTPTLNRPTESMGNGGFTIRCSNKKCENIIEIPNNFRKEAGFVSCFMEMGKSTWDAVYKGLEMCQAEAIRRWNIFNS